MIHVITRILFILLLVILFGRSLQYAYRIVDENLLSKDASTDPEIYCEKKSEFKSLEEERLHNYYMVGGTCKK